MYIVDDIKVYHDQLNSNQKFENDFFASSASVLSLNELYKIISWKMRSLWLLDEIITDFHLDFTGKVLELAGGYGVQAAYLKAKFGDKLNLTYSDTSINAVKSCVKFENFFGIKINSKWVAEAENIPAIDNSFDVVFFYAGFHHVQNEQQTIAECYRVLKSGGKLYLLLEPCCPKFWLVLYNKFKKKRLVPEKSFTRSEYHRLVGTKFSEIKQFNFKSYYNRETKKSLLYYLLIGSLPDFMLNLFPCSQVIIAYK